MTSGWGLNKSLGEWLWVFLHSNHRRRNGGCQMGNRYFNLGSIWWKAQRIPDLQSMVGSQTVVASHRLRERILRQKLQKWGPSKLTGAKEISNILNCWIGNDDLLGYLLSSVNPNSNLGRSFTLSGSNLLITHGNSVNDEVFHFFSKIGVFICFQMKIIYFKEQTFLTSFYTHLTADLKTTLNKRFTAKYMCPTEFKCI